MDDAALIRAVIEARVEALRRRDAAAAVAMLAPDLVAFEMAPPLRVPADAATDANATQSWLDGFEGPVETQIRDLVVHISGDVAFSHSLNRLTAMRVGGSRVDFWMRSTLGFRKVAGEWRIVHGHTSVPFRMDGSFAAALDLQP